MLSRHTLHFWEETTCLTSSFYKSLNMLNVWLHLIKLTLSLFRKLLWVLEVEVREKSLGSEISKLNPFHRGVSMLISPIVKSLINMYGVASTILQGKANWVSLLPITLFIHTYTKTSTWHLIFTVCSVVHSKNVSFVV